jgi:hypothetical protein
MATTMLISDPGSLKKTDDARFGFDRRRRGSEPAMADLTHELSAAVSDAYWSFMLQGELEDAFDTALLRAAMAETPILTGVRPIWGL